MLYTVGGIIEFIGWRYIPKGTVLTEELLDGIVSTKDFRTRIEDGKRILFEGITLRIRELGVVERISLPRDGYSIVWIRVAIRGLFGVWDNDERMKPMKKRRRWVGWLKVMEREGRSRRVLATG